MTMSPSLGRHEISAEVVFGLSRTAFGSVPFIYVVQRSARYLAEIIHRIEFPFLVPRISPHFRASEHHILVFCFFQAKKMKDFLIDLSSYLARVALAFQLKGFF